MSSILTSADLETVTELLRHFECNQPEYDHTSVSVHFDGEHYAGLIRRDDEGVAYVHLD